MHALRSKVLQAINRWQNDPLVRPSQEEEKHRLFNAISTIPVIQAKADWAAKWMNDDSSFAERLVGFAAVEGILFSGSFCAIYWLKKRGMMPGLTFSNELIARDEGLHADFACLLYSMLEKPLPAAIVHDIVKGAVAVEKTFICDALSCDLIQEVRNRPNIDWQDQMHRGILRSLRNISDTP